MQTLHASHAHEHCSPCFLHVHLPVLQPALQLHLIISINFMGAGDREVWMGDIFSSLIFQPHSDGTSLLAQPFKSWGWPCTVWQSSYLFTKSHIAECIKSFIWLSIIERNKKKNNPPGHSNTVAPVVNSIIAPAYCCSRCQSPWLLKHCSSFCYQPH